MHLPTVSDQLQQKSFAALVPEFNLAKDKFSPPWFLEWIMQLGRTPPSHYQLESTYKLNLKPLPLAIFPTQPANQSPGLLQRQLIFIVQA